VVKANGKCYRALPKHDDFDVSHLKKMIRHLDVDKKCANTFFKDLFSEYEVGRADAAKN
jgi:hypothetical protein